MSNNDNFKINVSSDSNDRFDDDNYKDIENQREQQRSQIEPVLNEMKTKIEEGKSKNSSYYLSNGNNPNPMLNFNNFDNNVSGSQLGMNMNNIDENNFNNNNMDININNNNMNMNISNNNMNISNNNMNMNNSNNNNFNMNNNNMIINKFNLDDNQSQISNNMMMNMNNNSIHSNKNMMMNLNNNSIHSNNNLMMNLNNNNSIHSNNNMMNSKNSIHSNNNMMMNLNNKNSIHSNNNMMNSKNSIHSNNNMMMNLNNNNSIHSNNNMMMNLNNNNSIHSNNNMMMNLNNNNSIHSNNNLMMNMNNNMMMNMNNNNSIHSNKNMMMNLNNNSIHSNNNMMMNMNNNSIHSIHSNNTGMNNNNFMNNQNIMDMNNSNINKMKDLNIDENNFNNNNSKYSNITNKILDDKNNLINNNMLNNFNDQNDNNFIDKENEMKSNSKLFQNLKSYAPPNPADLNNDFKQVKGSKISTSKKSSKIFDDNNSKHSKLFDGNNKSKNSKLLNDPKNSKIMNSSKNSKLIKDMNSSKNSKLLNESKNSKLIKDMNSSKNSKILNPSKNSKIFNDKSNKNSKVFNQNDFTNQILNNFEQEKQDTIRKTNIIEKHSVVYSSYYDYTPDEKEGHVNELLEDINYFGEIIKGYIEKELKLNPNKFISPDEALNNPPNKNRNSFFVLGLLGKVLESQGCLVVIEKDDPKNKEENKEINTTIQFLINNMYNFIKFIFHFDFGEEMNQQILDNEDKRNYFNNKLRSKLRHKFNLEKSDILMTNPRAGSYQITAIIKKSKFNDYSADQLYQELKEDIEFNKIIKVEKGILLSGCKLNPYMLDPRGDNSDGGWGFNEKRGNHPYYPPKGWNGYGLRVLDRFDHGNNAWIDYQNLDGEWAVAYHGVGSLLGRKTQVFNAINDIALNNLQTGMRQRFKDSNDIYHFGQKVGEGVYLTPKPEVLEQYSGVFKYNGTHYMVGFMTRVKPEKIRCPEEKQDYWVINGTDNEVRPYRILIKEVHL